MTKEFVFAGFGGQGTLLIGKFLAMACMLDGKHVSWLPSYGPEMRGGTANCSVIVSDDEIGSPLVSGPDAIIAMNDCENCRYAGNIASPHASKIAIEAAAATTSAIAAASRSSECLPDFVFTIAMRKAYTPAPPSEDCPLLCRGGLSPFSHRGGRKEGHPQRAA